MTSSRVKMSSYDVHLPAEAFTHSRVLLTVNIQDSSRPNLNYFNFKITFSLPNRESLERHNRHCPYKTGRVKEYLTAKDTSYPRSLTKSTWSFQICLKEFCSESPPTFRFLMNQCTIRLRVRGLGLSIDWKMGFALSEYRQPGLSVFLINVN